MFFAIDASSAAKQKRTGADWYSYHLIQALKSQTLESDDRVCLYSPSALQEELAVLPPQWETRVLHWPFSTGWMQGRMSWEMLRRSPNILFVPTQSFPRIHPHTLSKQRATVTTIHDIAFHRFPDLYDPIERKHQEKEVRFAIKHAEILLTPSEWTKKELADAYGVPLEQMVVTPLSHDVTHYHPLESTVVEEVLQKYRLSRKNYFLSIGRLERKKNIPLLIRAFEIFKRSRGTGDPFELVLIGMSGFGFEEIHQAVDCSPFKESIRPLGWVEEVDIPALMNGTFAYVFPSRYEGFGISNVEAMACGIPLLTSDIPAHREVVRDAGLFLSPDEPETWASGFQRITSDQGLIEDLVQKGIVRAQSFSWQTTARKTWDVLKGLV
ncbi:MAG: Glycosyl transferase group 1 [Candidatus Uhrbacteria bacterium GW2011_GWF2_41_16]|uniref:Glycosyl transferase group 1 n=2 Tax=Candidatus Uhriibacteriota TaxID=1752732 RepID=A0A0G0VD32_9BACT|nr:MAG: Glycosyl transferase group 1 [Candidatus Uhrbacteria bacterium GW2011_GWA2_41_10]KKR87855.1 MAG: Glycosyl transferase group 1 [Candidatus Uhrbacteria bacterium GW2011_GWC2_41_11]KKR98794.1 MAG: Glycosyl transferase group 1 [Candidatus Uhrbacteria bacterium GW2011_GWF2_41_16]